MRDLRPLRPVAGAALALSLALAAPVDADARPRRGAPPPAPPATAPEVPAGQRLVTVDADGDRVPEVWTFYREPESEATPKDAPSLLVRREMDLDRDGRADLSVVFAAGVVVREDMDLDFDGVVDQAHHYEAGERVRTEVLGPEGAVRAVRVYDGGELARIEADADADGRPERVEYYRRGEIVRVSHDDDGDGEVDRWSGI